MVYNCVYYCDTRRVQSGWYLASVTFEAYPQAEYTAYTAFEIKKGQSSYLSALDAIAGEPSDLVVGGGRWWEVVETV
jgi:hypothetical protein